MENKKIAIIIINKSGEKLAKKLKGYFENARIFNGRMGRNGSVKNLVETIFHEYDGLIFITALGITVRIISTVVKSKLSDPAVVSVDSAGRFAISVLSGHEGGANRLAFLAAACLDAMPVVTTGYEVHKKLILGVGTRKEITAAQVKRAIRHVLKKKKIELKKIRVAATIDIKKNEKGLLKACVDLGLPLLFIPKERIKYFKANISKSKVVKQHIGVDGVCEPCALLAGKGTKLIARKEFLNGVAVAISEEN